MKFLCLFLAILHPCFCARNELIATADCVCPGQNFTYECSVIGGRFTVWRGTVISSSCEITLFHSEFGVPGAARSVCNNGAVVGYNVGVDNNCYTSKLDIIVSPGLNGRTVKCIIDDGVTNTVINTSTLLITTTPFPPPTNVQLAKVVPGELTFSWFPPPQNCPSLTFNVISSDCGICQNNSALNNTTCRNYTLPSMCTLTVQSIICGNLASSTESTPVIARLNVPEAPTVTEVYPLYSENDRRLLSLIVNFNTIESFQIADGIDGSAISYTIIYSDSTSGSICSSVTIPTSSCADELCTHSFDTSSSFCRSSADINITIFATNVLGNGSTSQPLFQDGMNDFVDVDFNFELKTIICVFLNQPANSTKECLINITYGPNCDQHLDFYSIEGTGDSVSTPELSLIEGIAEYCFTVTSRSDNVTVTVNGTLNLIGVPNIISKKRFCIASTVVVGPVVAVIVVLVVLVVTLILFLLYYQCRKSLNVVVIRFSNIDKPGSLANMLKVFKDYNINIIRINAYWTKADIKWKLCGRHQMKENYVHISCNSVAKKELEEVTTINFEFIEDNGDAESVTEDSTTRTIRFFVEDKPGALWKAMNEFGKRGINILGLNTRSNYNSRSGYKDNFVSCVCTKRKERKIMRALINADALNVGVEYNIKPSTRIVQFYVKDKPGALSSALKAFRELNINTTGINPAYMKLPTRNIPGHEIFYVECSCDEDKKEILFEKLRKSASDAIKVEFHDDQQVISRKQGKHPDYCIAKFAIRDKVGSLVSALEVFQDLEINIIGVNSFDTDPGIELRPKIKLEYKSVEMVTTSKSDLKVPDLTDELESSDHITDVRCKPLDPPTEGERNYEIKFLARHEIGTLAKALQVLIKHNINIISLRQESVSRDVQYVHNHVRFDGTHEQEAKLISKLRATGLAMNVETHTLKWIEDHITKMKESHKHCSATQGAFEHEPPKADTRV